jgi:hypothetical protein
MSDILWCSLEGDPIATSIILPPSTTDFNFDGLRDMFKAKRDVLRGVDPERLILWRVRYF